MELLFGFVLTIHTSYQSLLCKTKAVRAIAFENYCASFSPNFLALDLHKLQHLLEVKLLSFVYESMNRISLSCFHCFLNFLSNVHQHHIRQALEASSF